MNKRKKKLENCAKHCFFSLLHSTHILSNITSANYEKCVFIYIQWYLLMTLAVSTQLNVHSKRKLKRENYLLLSVFYYFSIFLIFSSFFVAIQMFWLLLELSSLTLKTIFFLLPLIVEILQYITRLSTFKQTKRKLSQNIYVENDKKRTKRRKQ